MVAISIKNRAIEERPREKLRDKGAEALSNAELLAILIGSGTPQQDAVDLMQEILDACEGNLNALGRMSLEQLQRYNGIGEAKAITIQAACEIGRRRRREKVLEKPKFDTSAKLYEYMTTFIGETDVEEARVILLNQRLNLIRSILVTRGGLSETVVDVRLIIKEAVLANATNIVLCHNHPSGNPSPSVEDDQMTKRVQEACKVMRINLIDHIIVTDRNYYSYADNGRI